MSAKASRPPTAFSTKDLKARGWSDALISTFLGDPDRIVRTRGKHGYSTSSYTAGRVLAVEQTEVWVDAKDRSEAERTARAEAKRERKARQAAAAETAVSIRNPLRTVMPSRVTVHAGPTNSGKTTAAIRAVVAGAEHGRRCVFVSPLRMLCVEIADRLAGHLGERDTLLAGLYGEGPETGLVGILTGEEQFNVDAPVLVCTPEVAPMRGDLLVIDETHWVTDRDRGWAWTRLLIGAEFDEIEVIIDARLAEQVAAFMADVANVEVDVIRYLRRSPVEFIGKRAHLKDVPNRTAVVAFSRKGVLGAAQVLHRSGRKVGALYGALPPATRRMIIDRFLGGDIDVLVTTDVIGHGINLPVDEVCFLETDKFDGQVRRALRAWEAAQIGGRAGRDRNPGRISFVEMQGWRKLANVGLLQVAAQVAEGNATSDLMLTSLPLRPRLSDFTCSQPITLHDGLQRWARKLAETGLKTLKATALDDFISRSEVVLQATKASLTVEDHWALVAIPVEQDSGVWQVTIRAVHIGDWTTVRKLVPGVPREGASSETMEARIGVVRDLRAVCATFGPERSGLDAKELAALEYEIAGLLDAAVLKKVTGKDIAWCRCGKPKAPWFDSCENCHGPRWEE